MPVSITVPSPGQSFSTQAVVVDNNFTNLSSWANGAIQDTDLASPNNSVRRLLLHARMRIVGAGGLTNTDYMMTASGAEASPAQILDTGPADFWLPDFGFSSQPQDFQVAGKAAKARIRAVALVNNTAPGVSFTVGLYQVTALTGGTSVLLASFGSALAGSTATITTPAATQGVGAVSAEFALPVSGSVCFLGVKPSGTPVSANTTVQLSAQLYAYNA